MNDFQFIAPMIVMVTAIVTTGGVMVLRPLSKRVAELLHVIAQEKVAPPREKAGAAQESEITQVRELLATMDSRLALLEERQNFTEALLESGRRNERQHLPNQRVG